MPRSNTSLAPTLLVDRRSRRREQPSASTTTTTTDQSPTAANTAEEDDAQPNSTPTLLRQFSIQSTLDADNAAKTMFLRRRPVSERDTLDHPLSTAEVRGSTHAHTLICMLLVADLYICFLFGDCGWEGVPFCNALFLNMYFPSSYRICF